MRLLSAADHSADGAADAGHLHPATTANAPGLQRGRLALDSMEDHMSSTLIPACTLCGLRLASRQLLDLHIREDHVQRNRHAEPDYDHSGDLGDSAGDTGSAADGGPGAQAVWVPEISRNTARAALAGDGPPRYVRRPTDSVADEFEPRAWPYRLSAGGRWVIELDGPAVSAQECPDGSQDRRRQRGRCPSRPGPLSPSQQGG
jgi:hypothetical protein